VGDWQEQAALAQIKESPAECNDEDGWMREIDPGRDGLAYGSPW